MVPDRDELTAGLLVATLSRAIDMTEGNDLGHSLRAAWISASIGRALQLDEDRMVDLLYGTLLKDAGCSANSAQVSVWFGTDDRTAKRALATVNWSRYAEAARYAIQQVSPGAPWRKRLTQIIALGRHGPKALGELNQMRCTKGADLVRSLGWVKLAPDAVLNLHEHWDGRGQPHGLQGEQIPLLARIACLAESVEIFWQRYGVEGALAMASRRSGSWFDPHLVEIFGAAQSAPGYWQQLSDIARPEGIIALDARPIAISFEQTGRFTQIARMFADIVDAKSPWTYEHSVRTAAYAVGIAEQMGLVPAVREHIHLAALLHDLGKLGISNLILDKPGKLTAQEFEVMKKHPGWTYEILCPLRPLEVLAGEAAAHHERVDGSGYHRGLSGEQVPLAARVIAVADVFDALTAERPYRRGLDPQEALGLMRDEMRLKLAAEPFEALVGAVRQGAIAVGSRTGPVPITG